MRKTVFSLLAIALVLPCAFAVDGVVLINQATVMAAGGFSYIIRDAGSYKLSGNLIMNTTLLGNYFAVWDIAIAIASSNVILDLNGFALFFEGGKTSDIEDEVTPRQLGSHSGQIAAQQLRIEHDEFLRKSERRLL